MTETKLKNDSNAEILAIIPARGGSKGIPRKNIMQICGRPLIAFSIDHALESRLISRVIVSTDDPEIAKVAKDYGAEVPFMRPAELAQDLSPDLDVFRHAVVWLQEHEHYKPDLVVHLRPTGPVRRVEIIDKAITLMLQQNDADSLRSVCWPVQTPYKMWKIKNGFLEPLVTVEGIPEAYSMPRQVLPEVFWQNGYVDVIRPRTLLELNSMCGKRILPFIINEPIYEIDYPESIPVVEEALQRLKMGEVSDNSRSDHTMRHPV